MKVIFAGIVLFSLLGPVSALHAAEPKPNILLIITDDQGYGDFSIHGNTHLQTPNIDRLGAEVQRCRPRGDRNPSAAQYRWRYLRYENGHEELHDNASDPNEWINLAGQPELASVKAKLAKSLRKSSAAPLKSKKKPGANEGRSVCRPNDSRALI